MRRLLLLIPVLLLAGCMATPVKRTFPTLPGELNDSCAELSLIKEDTTELSEVVSVVSENYGKYHECKVKLDLLQQWYRLQKSNFEEVK